MLNEMDEKEIIFRIEAEKRMLDVVFRCKEEIEELYEEMEMILNHDLVRKIAKSREEMKRGELYGWKKFRDTIDE